MSFPSTVSGLIAALEEAFPEPAPRPGDPPDKVFYQAGQRSVIHWLKRKREDAGKLPPAPRPRGSGRPVR
jgi:hypothetical protein